MIGRKNPTKDSARTVAASLGEVHNVDAQGNDTDAASAVVNDINASTPEGVATNEANAAADVPSSLAAYDKRQAEIARYTEQYATNPDYRMGLNRSRSVNKLIGRLAAQLGSGSFLDVGTGRGEALNMAERHGFAPVRGTEVVESLLSERVLRAEAHKLPFDNESFDVVTCFDTLEHLLPEDVAPAIAELYRVARHILVISAATKPSFFGGEDLHISARPIEAWRETLASVIPLAPEGEGFVGATPCWLYRKPGKSVDAGE